MGGDVKAVLVVCFDRAYASTAVMHVYLLVQCTYISLYTYTVCTQYCTRAQYVHSIVLYTVQYSTVTLCTSTHAM